MTNIERIKLAEELLKCGLIKNPQHYFNIFNLSQEEIDALVEELYKENEEKGQLEFFGIPHIKDIPCTSPGYNTTIKLNMDCDHDWKIYQGLNQTDTYCTKCNEIKK